MMRERIYDSGSLKGTKTAGRGFGLRVGLFAVAALLLASALPAAGAAKGGNGGGWGCVLVDGNWPDGEGYSTLWACDNPEKGSSDCGDGGIFIVWAEPWPAAQKPDKNRDGLVCMVLFFMS